jgi:hypothetical protein
LYLFLIILFLILVYQKHIKKNYLKNINFLDEKQVS